ncbi:ABC transporter substrate-binding protein [Desulforamulus ruminis]|uniref:Extracellular solute-binding protein family 5 n=1 Tax=Desulforamulus ruminis (strain ATCC 23193 / DSM 2154 / NCIMB 8452 / DL) TaxID=696281 RepID=F6DKW8_DESRL|nr:ABC transporter substrate-binding protein [Desulforamulus ruminis]AEG61600.1 extracellular solute-binding protein family 5 [Desulforamulus ruminis DSM 2154]
MKRLFVFAMMLALMISGCGGGGEDKKQTGSPSPSDTLVVGMSMDLATLDPAVSMDNASWKISYPCYDRLVKYKTENGKGSTEVEPMAAQSWEVTPDGKVWTFKLREDIKFHDGSPLNAQAVKFSFDRVLQMAKGPADYFTTLDSVEAVDEYTVKFTLKEPFPPFLYTLATSPGSIVNPKVMEHEKDGDMASGWLGEHTMGSGAYELVEWNREQHLKLRAVENYWGGQPQLKTILAKIVKDPSAQRLQLENGDLDIAEGIPVDQLEKLKSNQDIKIIENPSLLVNYIYLNNQKKPLDNVKVRQALNYAIDYDGMIQGVMLGNATQVKGPIPEGLWGHDPNVKQYKLDLNKSKELLAEAGYPQGFTIKLLYADYKPWWEQEALIIQDNLSKVGVKVELEKLAWATLRDKVDRADFDICLGVWSPDYADPHMFMNYWFDSENHGLAGNRAFYQNSQVDQLLREAARINDQEKRTELYRQVQNMVMEEAPYILLFQNNSLVPMRKNIEGYVYNPMLESMYNFENMKK